MRTAIPIGIVVVIVGLLGWLWPSSEKLAPSEPPPDADEILTPTPAPPRPEPESEPDESGIVRGRIVDGEGRPVAGAEVKVYRGAKVKTDADGRFAIPGGPKARAHLSIRDRRFRDGRAIVDSTSSGHVIRLDEGLAVSGRVTATDGHGVEGLWVTVGRQRSRTGADGRYRITGLSPGERSVTCHSPRHRFTDEEGEQLLGSRGRTQKVPAGSEGVDFVVKGRPLEVRVISGEGGPLGGVSVAAWAHSGSHRARRGRTEADGRAFTLVSWTRRLDVTASLAGYEPALATLTPETWEKRLTLTLTLQRPGTPAELAVQALDEEGRPYRGLYVSLMNPVGIPLEGYRDLRVDLDATGSGRLTGLPPGRLTALVSDARYLRSESGYGLHQKVTIELTRGETSRADLRIPLGGRIRLEVRDEAGELTGPGQVFIRRVDGGRMARVYFGYRTEDGFERTGSHPVEVFTMKPVPPGEYQLTIGWRKPSFKATVTVAPGKTAVVSLRRP